MRLRTSTDRHYIRSGWLERRATILGIIRDQDHV
jgi:hypothetical protein